MCDPIPLQDQKSRPKSSCLPEHSFPQMNRRYAQCQPCRLLPQGSQEWAVVKGQKWGVGGQQGTGVLGLRSGEPQAAGGRR